MDFGHRPALLELILLPSSGNKTLQKNNFSMFEKKVLSRYLNP
jgi:hypothetical protein